MSETTPDNNERSPFTKPGFILAAALIVALIAAVAVIALLPRGNEEPNTQPTTPASSPAPATSAPAADESVCGLPSSDETTLGAAPESEWELAGKVVVPTEPETAGPGTKEEDGFRACFAQTPTGALFAAANLIGLGSTDDVDLQLKFTEQLVVPGVGQEAALDDLRQREKSSTASSSDASLQIAGFQLRSYKDDAANVDIAFRVDNGAIGHANIPLRWLDGDWKAELADNGQLLNDPVQLNDLSGYIPWRGV